MRIQTRTVEAPVSGLKCPVVENGPRWVFELWDRASHRCSARTAQGGQCRRYVNLQSGVSRFCERHRTENEPVYYVQSTQREAACPCGCGYGVLTLFLTATLISGQPRRERPLTIVPEDEQSLRRTS